MQLSYAFSNLKFKKKDRLKVNGLSIGLKFVFQSCGYPRIIIRS